MLDHLLQDLRYAFRTLARRPGFTALATLILALGIGANVAIFSVAYGVLLRPLPYADPERLVVAWPGDVVNKRAALAVEERMGSLAGVTAYSEWGLPLTGVGGEPEAVVLARVSPRHFEVLGARPLLGRGFTPEESAPGNERVAVLGHGLWQRRFGGEASALGRTLELDGEPYTIVGIMPADHRPLRSEWQLWTPLPIDLTDENDLDGSFYLTVVGRLRPGVTRGEAEAELRVVAAALRDERPQRFTNDRVEGARLAGLHEHLVGEVRPALLVLMGAVGFILLIACANVANLLLARASGRAHELAVRAAMGAGRGRIVRQLMAESVLLGIAGGVAGLLAAAWAFDLVWSRLPADLPRSGEIALDAPVLAFSALASLAAAALFGLAPALRAVHGRLGAALHTGAARSSADPRRQRLAAALVVFQIAASVVLLVGAGLVLQSLLRLRAVDPGFRPEGVLAMRLAPPAARYAAPGSVVEYYGRVLERVRAVPGVRDAGAIHLMPLESGNWSFPYRYEGQVIPPGQPAGTSLPSANFRVVTPGYFRTLEIPLLRGRVFDARDRADAAPVGIVNRALAKRLWPGEDAVGKRIFLFGGEDNAFTVVGVVGDVRQHALAQQALPEMYRPHPQFQTDGMVVLARVAGAPLDAADALRAAVWSVDPEVPIADLRPAAAVVAASTAETRFTASAITAFAALALVLGMVGVYGVVAYAVELRVPEIGIRMAFGARRIEVARDVLGRGLRLTLAGLAVGLAGSLALGRFLASLLYGVEPVDVATYVAVALLTTAAALASTWLPARRASAVDPIAVLRHE